MSAFFNSVNNLAQQAFAWIKPLTENDIKNFTSIYMLIKNHLELNEFDTLENKLQEYLSPEKISDIDRYAILRPYGYFFLLQILRKVLEPTFDSKHVKSVCNIITLLLERGVDPLRYTLSAGSKLHSLFEHESFSDSCARVGKTPLRYFVMRDYKIHSGNILDLDYQDAKSILDSLLSKDAEAQINLIPEKNRRYRLFAFLTGFPHMVAIRCEKLSKRRANLVGYFIEKGAEISLEESRKALNFAAASRNILMLKHLLKIPKINPYAVYTGKRFIEQLEFSSYKDNYQPLKVINSLIKLAKFDQDYTYEKLICINISRNNEVRAQLFKNQLNSNHDIQTMSQRFFAATCSRSYSTYIKYYDELKNKQKNIKHLRNQNGNALSHAIKYTVNNKSKSDWDNTYNIIEHLISLGVNINEKANIPRLSLGSLKRFYHNNLVFLADLLLFYSKTKESKQIFILLQILLNNHANVDSKDNSENLTSIIITKHRNTLRNLDNILLIRFIQFFLLHGVNFEESLYNDYVIQPRLQNEMLTLRKNESFEFKGPKWQTEFKKNKIARDIVYDENPGRIIFDNYKMLVKNCTLKIMCIYIISSCKLDTKDLPDVINTQIKSHTSPRFWGEKNSIGGEVESKTECNGVVSSKQLTV